MLRIREGAGITIFRQIVLSHSTESFRRGTLLCFRKIWVSKNFMPKRGLSHFSIENLVSHSTENFVGEPLCVSQNFWYRKDYWIRRGREGISRFSVENFWSHSAENLQEEPLVRH